MAQSLTEEEEQVWARVRDFAIQRKADGHAIWTLQKRIANTIKDVHDLRIERASAKGRTNDTPIRRGEVIKVWRALVSQGHTRKGQPNYFTLALLQAAMPDVIDDLGDGSIALHGRVPVVGGASRPFSYAEAATLGRGARAHDGRSDIELRESDEHWNIKHYIHRRPNDALAQLDGGPWAPAALELSLPVPTSDRVDVIVRDGEGYYTLIEVKPWVGERSTNLYAQAAKYRAMWQVLHDTDGDQVRCVLAAPEIPTAIARHMYRRHRIESVAVEVPDDFVAPPRET